MPQLIKTIVGTVNDNTTGDVVLVKTVIGNIQQEDYINLNGFTAYIQNLSRAEDTVGLTNPINFGLKNGKKLEIVTFNIDY